jgi:hypothetical protein
LSPPLRNLLVISSIVAALAFGIPWLTHFADQGISFTLLLLWIGLVVAGLMRYRLRGLWLLTGAPLALFWPVALLIVILRGDLYLGF